MKTTSLAAVFAASLFTGVVLAQPAPAKPPTPATATTAATAAKAAPMHAAMAKHDCAAITEVHHKAACEAHNAAVAKCAASPAADHLKCLGMHSPLHGAPHPVDCNKITDHTAKAHCTANHASLAACKDTHDPKAHHACVVAQHKIHHPIHARHHLSRVKHTCAQADATHKAVCEAHNKAVDMCATAKPGAEHDACLAKHSPHHGAPHPHTCAQMKDAKAKAHCEAVHKALPLCKKDAHDHVAHAACMKSNLPK